MAVTYGFFNSMLVNGMQDRRYNADQMSTYFKGLISDGVYQNVGGGLQVKAGEGMLVQVMTGRGVFDSRWLENDSILDIPLEPSHVTLNRYTAVVVRVDYNERTVSILAKDGETASAPVKPAIARTESVKEYCLAYVYVGRGVTDISQSAVTDTRPDNALCGFVTGLVEQIQTTDLFAQYDAAFDEWFETIEGKLSGDVAGKLTVDVERLEREKQDKISGTQGRIVGFNENGEAVAQLPLDAGVLPISGGTLTGNLTIKGAGNYGTKINLGDGDYVHISESTDNCMEIKAKKVNFVISSSDSNNIAVNGKCSGVLVGWMQKGMDVQLTPTVTKKATKSYSETFNDKSSRTFSSLGRAVNGNVAEGYAAHAEGRATTALGDSAPHAEGFGTIAALDGAHAEGRECIAVSSSLRAFIAGINQEEKYFEIKPNSSFFNKTEIGDVVISQGYDGDAFVNVVTQVDTENNRIYVSDGIFTNYGYPYFLINASKVSGSVYGSHAEGANTFAFGTGSHAEGYSTLASSFAHAEGYKTHAESGSAHAEGKVTYATGIAAHAEGKFCVVSDCIGHAEGVGCVASNFDHMDEVTSVSYEERYIVVKSEKLFSDLSINDLIFLIGNGDYHAIARVKSIDAATKKIYYSEEEYNVYGNGIDYKYVFKLQNPSDLSWEAYMFTARAAGRGSIALADCANASGKYAFAKAEAQTAIGKANVISENVTDRFIVGKGSSQNYRANCLRVTNTGVYASGNYNASGADYAEFFEWFDGNLENADRAGLFVTLEGEKIRLAQPGDDFILGIVSAEPSVCGDVYDDQWKGMYLYDIYGRPLWEDVEVPDETVEEVDPENPGRTITRVIIPAHTEHRQKLNPDYDNTQPYVPRSERPEWDAVGMLGKLVAQDDGTCRVNEWCAVGENGTATYSGARTKYRVMARLDENHVRVLIL